MITVKNNLAILILLFGFVISGAATAEDIYQESHMATSDILFDYDDSFEYVSFKVDDRGWLDIVFASNTPDDLYEEILNKLLNHPKIPGVLAGKGGAMCSLF